MRQTQADLGRLQVGCTFLQVLVQVCIVFLIPAACLSRDRADTPREKMVEEDEAARSNTARRLWVHVLEKGWQAGSVLGTAATGVLRLKDAITSSSRPAAACLKYMGYAGIGGFAAVGVLAALKISQLDEEGIADRGYRLYYNAGQNRADAFARVGAAAGLVLSGAVVSNPSPLQRLGVAAGTTCVAVLAHVATAPSPDNQGPNKMLHEIKNS